MSGSSKNIALLNVCELIFLLNTKQKPFPFMILDHPRHRADRVKAKRQRDQALLARQHVQANKVLLKRCLDVNGTEIPNRWGYLDLGDLKLPKGLEKETAKTNLVRNFRNTMKCKADESGL